MKLKPTKFRNLLQLPPPPCSFLLLFSVLLLVDYGVGWDEVGLVSTRQTGLHFWSSSLISKTLSTLWQPGMLQLLVTGRVSPSPPRPADSPPSTSLPSICLAHFTPLSATSLSLKPSFYLAMLFRGSLPFCFGLFSTLKTLDLSYNMFGGPFPQPLVMLNQLTELDLSHNAFAGEIPVWVGNFSLKLEKLNLGFNAFRGEMPASLYYAMSLRYLDLSQNYLMGSLADFNQALVYLNLESNSFSGTLPCFLSSSQSLSVLNLANNSIMGGIPACISSCHGLTQLNLSSNELQYGISPRLVFSEKLVVLDLSFNGLSGDLPRNIVETPEKSGLCSLIYLITSSLVIFPQ
ncbi:UNVERIFIED_CONTAM: hypothetical protein Scaly_0542600 [Sesamum calycinum]|uniref:Uncharacterized protein n=1 Tax=Sesamum calycinum TaxID=2727403 RepID=A0AAW2RRG3_9LAMI